MPYSRQRMQIYETQGPKTCRLSFLAILLNHILRCIYFKVLFTVSEYLVPNWSYTRLIRTIKKVKKSKNWIKSCHHNSLQSLLHYSEINPSHKGLYSVSNKANSIKTELQLYNLWQIHGHQLNWKITNSKTPILASSSISRKWQATGFEPLCHI